MNTDGKEVATKASFTRKVKAFGLFYPRASVVPLFFLVNPGAFRFSPPWALGQNPLGILKRTHGLWPVRMDGFGIA